MLNKKAEDLIVQYSNGKTSLTKNEAEEIIERMSTALDRLIQIDSIFDKPEDRETRDLILDAITILTNRYLL